MIFKTKHLLAAFVGGGTAVLGMLTDKGSVKQWVNSKRVILFNKGICDSSTDKVKPQELQQNDRDSIKKAAQLFIIEQARSLVQRLKEEQGCPGLSISVDVNGRSVWSEGFGYADVENNVQCQPSTVMRIASISKPLTATAIMKLLDEGKLNLDDPVQKYVSSFPAKIVNSKECTITIRHLLSHLAGIRHYHEKKNESNKTNENETKGEATVVPELEKPEYYIKECYNSVEKSLSLFKDDPLVHEPGSAYLYTTFGWSLVSAVVEGAAQQDFLKYMNGLFEGLGMNHTSAELHDKLIYGRARFYLRDSKGRLKNTPYVDNCYKYAGGGFLSTTEDLVKFGNAMLYSSQVGNILGKEGLLPGILSTESMSVSWEIAKKTEGKVYKKGGYGLGWMIFPSKHEHGCCKNEQKVIFHTGSAVGASSALLILPKYINVDQDSTFKENVPPKGVVVAILTNLSNVGLSPTCLQIAKLFQNFEEL